MIVLGIILAIFVLIALLPLGAHVRFDSCGPWCALFVGPIRLQLLPKKVKKKKNKKKDKKKKTKKPKKEKEKKEREKQPIGGLIRDFYPFVKLGLSLLGCFFRKLHVDILTLHVSFGGAGDAASAAVNYGRAWAVIGGVMPQLRRVLHIRKENVSASCDFTEGQMRVFAELRVRFLLGDLVAMGIRYGLRALKLLLAIKKRKNSEKAVQTNEPSTS